MQLLIKFVFIDSLTRAKMNFIKITKPTLNIKIGFYYIIYLTYVILLLN